MTASDDRAVGDGGPITILHVSDLHFGRPGLVALEDALEAHLLDRRYDVVAVSGDLSQRARAGELQRAHVFLRDAARVSRVIVVPGNHDVTWWTSPLHLRGENRIFAKYRKYISGDLEPVLRIPGATFVGLNTAHGVSLHTLTWNPRDISIIGDVRPSQLARAAGAFGAAPSSDARILVMHHNPLRGEISNRFGLKHTTAVLRACGEMGVDLVLCGHDHQESVAQVNTPTKQLVVSTAGTLSNRSRGGRTQSAHALRVSGREIAVTALVWSESRTMFEPGPSRSFTR